MSFASDVPVSLPEPVTPGAKTIDMYGFCLDDNGVVRPSLSAADFEHLSTLPFAPADPWAGHSAADAGLKRQR